MNVGKPIGNHTGKHDKPFPRGWFISLLCFPLLFIGRKHSIAVCMSNTKRTFKINFTNQTCLDHWVPNMNVDLHGKLNNCASCSANFTKGENHGISEVRGCSTKVWQHRHTANISMSASRLVILSRVWRLLAWWFLWFQIFDIPHDWKQFYT